MEGAETTAEAASPIKTMAEAASPIEAMAEATSPIERVTNSHKNKDLKKIAAGEKGAAARKAKEEVLLEQLRKAKEKIQPPPSPARAKPAPTEAESPTAPKAEQSMGISYVVLAGAAAVAIGALLLSTQKSADAADMVKVRAPEAGAVLNKQPDPFYMP